CSPWLAGTRVIARLRGTRQQSSRLPQNTRSRTPASVQLERLASAAVDVVVDLLEGFARDHAVLLVPNRRSGRSLLCQGQYAREPNLIPPATREPEDQRSGGTKRSKS